MNQAVANGQRIRTIRLGVDKINDLLARRDSEDPPRTPESGAREYKYHSHSFHLRLESTPGGTLAEHLGVSRKLSSESATVLMGQYVHANTKCEVQLVSAHGSWEDVPGIVHRCIHVEGPIHEASIRFTRRVDLAAFCAESIQRSVLLVEDSSFLVRLAKRFLQEANATVDHVDNGEDAVARAHERSYDIILMDIELPGIDGVEATRRIRASGYKGQVVATTARTSAADVEACLAAGCNSHVPKPYDREVLSKLLANLQPEAIFSTLPADPTLSPLIQEFVEELPASVAGMLSAFQSRDWESLGRASRSLMSVAGSLGFDPLADAARELEAELNGSDPSVKVSPKLDRLHELCGLVRSNEPA